MAKITLLHHKSKHKPDTCPLTIWYRARPPIRDTALLGGYYPVAEILKAEMAKYRQYQKKHNREHSWWRQRDRGRKRGRRQELRRRRTRGTAFQAEQWKHRIRLSEKCWWNYSAAGTILQPDMEASFWLKDDAPLRENGFKILAVEPIWKLGWSHWLQP